MNFKSNYEKLLSNKYCKNIISFFNSYYFLFVVGLITLISSSFSLEILCFTLFAILAMAIFCMNDDTKPIISILLCFQMGMSYKNGLSYNPNPDLPTIYDNKIVQIYFAILIALVVISSIFNFIFFKQYKNIKFNRLIALPPILLLSLGYILGGITSENYTQNLIYSLTNILMILGLYLYFSVTSFKSNTNVLKYISFFMLMVAMLVGAELIHIYLTTENIIVNGEIDKSLIKNGWGIHNNFSCYFILSIPFVLYLIITEERNYKYYLSFLAIVLFTFLTLSRNAYAIIVLEILVSIIVVLIIKRKKIMPLLIGLSLIILIGSTVSIIFKDEIYKLIDHILNLGLNLNGRNVLYKIAWKAYQESPIFGKGWFIFENSIGTYEPPISLAPSFKGHNIILQLLGSTGLFGLICFALFLIYILVLVFRNCNSKKIILLSSIIVLILSSILDNFFFDYSFERFLAIFIVGISLLYKNDEIINKEAPVNE